MHILVFPSFYPSRARPITGSFFKDQVDALRRAGHQVGVLVGPRIRETLDDIRRTRSIPNLKTAAAEPDGVYRMHWGWFPRVFPAVCAWLTGPAGLRAFADYCDRHGQPDVIHAHNIFYTGYMAVEIRKHHHVPVVLTEHSTNFLRGRIFLPGQHHIAGYTLDCVDAALAVGPALAARLNAYGPGRAVGLIHNIVNTEFFVPGENPAADRPFTFAVVGALIGRKGVDVLLRAFAQAFQGRPDVRLRIGGDGPARGELARLAAALGITVQVEFLGRLDRPQVRDLFQQCHVVVSASHTETFGVTLIEAMACGKPVIATRSGGPEAFITDDTGLLVPTGDVAALTGAMGHMVEHYTDYAPDRIRDYCVSSFSEAVIVQQLESIYQQVRQSQPS